MALSGFSVNGICAADSAASMDQIAQQFPVVTSNAFYDLQNISAASAPTFSATIKTNPLPSGVATVKTFDFVLLPCDPTVSTSPYFDGMQMGWGVVAAMAVAASIIQIKHSFFR